MDVIVSTDGEWQTHTILGCTVVLVDYENNFAKENCNCLNVKLWQYIFVILAGISNVILKTIINVLRDHVNGVWFQGSTFKSTHGCKVITKSSHDPHLNGKENYENIYKIYNYNKMIPPTRT